MARVIIPENPDQLLELIENALEKEQNLAPNSTLTPDELAELTQLYDRAVKDNAAQKELYRQAEELTRSRDNALGLNLSVNQPNTAKYLVTSLRDILLAKNKTNVSIPFLGQVFVRLLRVIELLPYFEPL